ncbi:MAG: right-handed parallel beta-helix repeat-containing protein, partial [Candidatus Hinthialibacter sp.]
NAPVGVLCTSSSPILRENVITNIDVGSTSGDGIRLDNSSPDIENNVISHVGGMGIRGQGDSEPRIINNTIYDYQYYAGIGFASLNIGAVNPIVTNNIIVRGNEEPVAGILWRTPASLNVSYNNVYDPAGAETVAGPSYYAYHDGTQWNETSGGDGAISVDPLFLDPDHDSFYLQSNSPCIDAGDPNPIYNDADGSRNDMGAFGGQRLETGQSSHPGSGFLFTSVGRIPIDEIVQNPADPSFGLASVSATAASDFHIPQFKDAPFGGHLWIRGLFGVNDPVDYYQILATPEGSSTATPLSDPLVKTRYTINPDGTVTRTRERLGPLTIGGVSNLYQLNKEGTWSQEDLRMIWNTSGLNGKYELSIKAYQLTSPDVATEVSLPSNTNDHMTLWLDSTPLQVKINEVLYADGTGLEECEGIVFIPGGGSQLIFDITANHASGFLRRMILDCYWGHNHFGGRFLYDQYVGSHEASPPLWSGYLNEALPPLSPLDSAGNLMPWEDCAYRFRIYAQARTTDGYRYLHEDSYSVYHHVETAVTAAKRLTLDDAHCLDCEEESEPLAALMQPLATIPAPPRPSAKSAAQVQRVSTMANGPLDAEDFVDNWVNVDPDTPGITRIEISRSGANMVIHAFGQCTPTDCDWGPISVPYTGNPFVAVYEQGFKTNTLTLELINENTLNVHSVNVFHDGTGRDYSASYVFTGSTLWVDDDNTSGTEDGSMLHPYNTIQEGIDAGVFGQIVRVMPGEYAESVMMKDGVSVIGSGAEETLIDSGGTGTGVYCSNISPGALFAGFTVSNAATGIYCNSSHLTIRENVITNIDISSLSGDGIRLDDSSPEIRNNLIHNVGGMGIRGQGDSEPQIINNTIYNYRYYAAISFAALNIGPVSPLIKNNIVMRGNEQPVGGILWSAPASAIVSYNDVYGVANVTFGGSLYAYHDGASWNEMPGGDGAISEDPQFIDPVAGFFYLDLSSPCIDAGDPDPAYNDNDGTRNDMGAYGGLRFEMSAPVHT